MISHVADHNQAMSFMNFILTKPGWIIKSVTLFNETLFPDSGDCLVVQPQASTTQISVPLRSEKNIETQIDIRVLTGAGTNSQ